MIDCVFPGAHGGCGVCDLVLSYQLSSGPPQTASVPVHSLKVAFLGGKKLAEVYRVQLISEETPRKYSVATREHKTLKTASFFSFESNTDINDLELLSFHTPALKKRSGAAEEKV